MSPGLRLAARRELRFVAPVVLRERRIFVRRFALGPGRTLGDVDRAAARVLCYRVLAGGFYASVNP